MNSSFPQMSDYEKEAWELLTSTRSKVEEKTDKAAFRFIGKASSTVGKATAAVSSKAGQAKEKVLENEKAKALADVTVKAVERSLGGIYDMLNELGMDSVNTTKVVQRYQKHGHELRELEDLRTLDLKSLDKVALRRKKGYIIAGATSGGATSLMTSGAVVSSMVSGGVTAGVAAGALAADAVATLMGSARIVSTVAAHYGYDVTLPNEQAFATAVLQYSSAKSVAEKSASMMSLSNLVQLMQRNPTWAQLNERVLVKIIQEVFKRLGLKLTKAKLAGAVPVAGVLLNGGLNVANVNQAFEKAAEAYRMKFLADKYGLDPDEWVQAGIARAKAEAEEYHATAEDATPTEEMLDVEVLAIDEIVAEELGDDEFPSGDPENH